MSVVLHKVKKENFVFSLQTDKFNRKSSLIERIDFIAWEPSAGVVGEFTFEAGHFDHVKKRWQEYQFSSPLYGIQSLVAVSQKMSKNRQKSVFLRNLKWSGIEALFAKFAKKRSKQHGVKTHVGFIALSFIPPDLDSDGDGLTDRDEIQIYGTNPTLADSDGDGLADGYEVAEWGDDWDGDTDGDGLVNILDIDSDNDGYCDGLEFVHGFDPADPRDFPDGSIMISGDLSVDSEWQSVSFGEKWYLDPAVVVVPAADTSPQAVFRVRNVVSTGFEIRRADQVDNVLGASTVSYIVMERGIYSLPGGGKVVAGHVTIKAKSRRVKHKFIAPFENIPVIMASIGAGAEFDPVSVDLSKITSRRFRLGLYDFTGRVYLNSPVVIDYIAWEPPAGLTDILHHE